MTATRPRIGSRIAGVTAGLENNPPPLGAEKLGRPQTLTEEYSKITILFYDSQTEYLDDVSTAMKRAAKPAKVNFNRAILCRAMVEGLKRSGLKVEEWGAKEEADLIERFRGVFTRARG